MTKIDDGGLAFSGTRMEQLGTVSDHGFVDDESPTFGDVRYPGMTIRDYFAASALQAYMSWSLSEPRHDGDSKEIAAARYSRTAYFVADAMISARKSEAQ